MTVSKMEKKHPFSDYALLYISFIIYSFVSVCAKAASGREDIRWTLFFIGLEIAFLGIYALFWQQVLKRFPVTVAVSSKGVTVIFALIWSVFLFHESITVFNVLGAALIVAGVRLVSSDE